MEDVRFTFLGDGWKEPGVARELADFLSGAGTSIASRCGFSSKGSTPYTPTSVHDFLYVKIMVVDDEVFAASYNFSRAGEENAENLLRLDSVGLAEQAADYIYRLIARYGPSRS